MLVMTIAYYEYCIQRDIISIRLSAIIGSTSLSVYLDNLVPHLLNKRGNMLVMTIAYYEFIMSSVFNEILSR